MKGAGGFGWVVGLVGSVGWVGLGFGGGGRRLVGSWTAGGPEPGQAMDRVQTEACLDHVATRMEFR